MSHITNCFKPRNWTCGQLLCKNSAAGLYKLWNPAIPDWRTWRKFGAHGEHGKDGKHQPEELKRSVLIRNTIRDSKHSICQPDDSKHSFYSMYRDSWKIITYAIGDPNQLKIREHQRDADEAGCDSKTIWILSCSLDWASQLRRRQDFTECKVGLQCNFFSLFVSQCGNDIFATKSIVFSVWRKPASIFKWYVPCLIWGAISFERLR